MRSIGVAALCGIVLVLAVMALQRNDEGPQFASQELSHQMSEINDTLKNIEGAQSVSTVMLAEQLEKFTDAVNKTTKANSRQIAEIEETVDNLKFTAFNDTPPAPAQPAQPAVASLDPNKPGLKKFDNFEDLAADYSLLREQMNELLKEVKSLKERSTAPSSTVAASSYSTSPATFSTSSGSCGTQGVQNFSGSSVGSVVYSQPSYSTPVYSQPTYSRPVYSTPVYQSSYPTYSTPSYQTVPAGIFGVRRRVVVANQTCGPNGCN